MYGAMWRRLPGPWPVRLVQVVVLTVGVLALLFLVVFPAADPHLPFNRETVRQAPAATTAPVPTTTSLVPGG